MYCKFLSVSLVTLLVGCGGGSDSSDSNNSSFSSVNVNSTTSNTLSIMAKYKDSCGNETAATDAALLIHNSDYSNEEIIYADANGLLTYTTDNANQTLSILMREEDEVNGIKPIYLTTFIDQPVVNMGNHYQHTDSIGACQCDLFDLEVNIPGRTSDVGEGSISGGYDDGNVDNNEGTTNFTGVLACKKTSGAWPLISTFIGYINPDEGFAAIIPDISTMPATTANLVGIPVNVITNDEAITQVSTVIDGKYHLSNYGFQFSSSLYGFAADSVDFYSVSAYKFKSLNDLLNVDNAYFFTVSSESDSNLNRTFDLPLPEIDYLELFEILMSDSGEYDLSYLPNMDYLSVGIQATDDYQTVLNWELIAPMSGKVPNIDSIDLTAFISEDILDTSVDTIETNISVLGYDGIDGYQDFMTSKLELTNESHNSDKWSKYESIIFEMTLNKFSIANSSTVYKASKVSNGIKKRKNNNRAINAFDKFVTKQNQ
ncbi:MAG: hypothetical protein ACI9YH_000715 [Colwellia sp.]|jgi:hypothetical protein